MSKSANVRIDRLVIDGGNVSAGEGREVARLLAEQLSNSWHGDAPSITRTTVRATMDTPRGLAVGPLAEQMAKAVRQALG
jgi:hypothetical protein